MTEVVSNSDFFLAERLRKNILSESRIKRAKAFAHMLIGFGLFLVFGSIGLYIASLGYARISDSSSFERKIGIMIGDALKNMELKADVSGKVNLTSDPFSINPLASVHIDKSSEIKISPESIVTINGNIKIIQPAPSKEQLGLEVLSKSGQSPITDYVIFREVKFGIGNVVTQFHYDINFPDRPKKQICMYEQIISGRKSTSFEVGINAIQTIETSATKFGLKPDELFKYCQWI